MGFFDDVVDVATGIPGRLVDIGESGLLGPGVALATNLASGGSLSEALTGATGPAGVAGAIGLAQAAASGGPGFIQAGAGAAGGAAAFVRQATAINNTLAQILASNGIHPAPTGNIKATVVLLLTPQGTAFIDSVDRGTPAVMSRDMQTTKKTLRKIAKMAKKIPRRTVEPSLNAQINTQVKQKILQDVGCSSALRIEAPRSTC